MNDVVFSTGGDWNSTTLHNCGTEVAAAQLFVELRAGRDAFGEPVEGGVRTGGDMTAIVRLQEDPGSPIDVFPGRLEMSFPGHQILIENMHPTLFWDATRVWYNGRDVTEHVVDVYVDINAADDVVQAYVTLYKPHWIVADEVATYNIL